MKLTFIFTLVSFAAIFQACTLLKDIPSDGLATGVYDHSFGDSIYTSYLENIGDTVFVNVLNSQSFRFELPLKKDGGPDTQSHLFSRRTFDLDIITIPLKLRPSVGDFPPQLNTDFNGNIFIGSRWDNFIMEYGRSPIGTLHQEITHYGYSIGAFGGLGSTTMNPWVTNEAIEIEYDGVIALAGISGTVAINDFTLGMGIGIDFLLDKNRSVWIYEKKPWLGLTFGVNLN
ncbi:MAG TPA: hypothetical protein VEC36_01805 [Patescibacteria group bacterium]|nr:hypothetical protein [Patescibacteria group bacterium]